MHAAMAKRPEGRQRWLDQRKTTNDRPINSKQETQGASVHLRAPGFSFQEPSPPVIRLICGLNRWKLMMSPHVDDLLKLRSLSVQKRRQLVRDLANPEARDSVHDLRDLFHKVQTTIETIDRALVD